MLCVANVFFCGIIVLDMMDIFLQLWAIQSEERKL